MTSTLFDGRIHTISWKDKADWKPEGWDFFASEPERAIDNDSTYLKKYFRDVLVFNVYLRNPGTLSFSIFERLGVDRVYSLKPIEFDRAVFGGKTTFEDSYFGHKLLFSNCVFQSTLLFSYVGFGQTLQFFNTTFKGVLRFNQTVFSDELLFDNVIFLTAPSFSQVSLPKHLQLKNVDLSKIEHNIDFIDAKLPIAEQKCSLLIEGTDVSKLTLNYELFEIDTSNHPPREQLEAIYEQIIKNCRDKGLAKSAEGFDIELQRFRINHDHSRPVAWVWNHVQHYWWNYSYNQTNILGAMLLFFCIFWLLNYIFYNSMLTKVYYDSSLGSQFLPVNTRNNRDSLVIFLKDNHRSRVLYILHYTSVVYFGLRMNHEALSIDNIFGILYLYFMYVVGIFHLAYGASYILGGRLL